jgi:hypothetical protein
MFFDRVVIGLWLTKADENQRKGTAFRPSITDLQICPPLLMTAKLMSSSVCCEPISKIALLYQGTTSVVSLRASRTRALAPAPLFPSQFGFGSVRQLDLRGEHYLCSIQWPPRERL